MLGDTAIAVNPADERYRDLVGKRAILPLMDRPIPIIADDFVDREFGTGMVKITPAHDPNDYQAGKRHGLEEINVLTPKGAINENGGTVRGPRPLQGAQSGGRGTREAGPARKDRGLWAACGRMLPLPHADRAIHQPAVVREDAPPGRTRAQGGGGRPRALPPRGAQGRLLPLARLAARLGNLAAAVVGPPNPGVLRCGRGRACAPHRRRVRGNAPRLPRRQGTGAGSRCARHLVLLGTVAILHAGMARRGKRRPQGVLPHLRAGHGKGHHLLLGGTDDHDGPALPR